MREFKEVKVQESKSKLISVTCNKCGEEIDTTQDKWEDEFLTDKFHDFIISFGYGSSFDTDIWKFDLCERCLHSFVRTFVKLPDGYDRSDITRGKINLSDELANFSTVLKEYLVNRDDKQLEVIERLYNELKGQLGEDSPQRRTIDNLYKLI